MKIHTLSIAALFNEVSYIKNQLAKIDPDEQCLDSLSELISIEEVQEIISKSYGYNDYKDLIENHSLFPDGKTIISNENIDKVRNLQSLWVADILFKKGISALKADAYATMFYFICYRDDHMKMRGRTS